MQDMTISGTSKVLQNNLKNDALRAPKTNQNFPHP
jgi:hypothetical protein